MNKAILQGRLGSDVKMGETASGTPYGQVSVATTESWKDSNGERQSVTTWHNLTLFGKLAEIAKQVSTKGTPVLVEGSIRSRRYTSGKDLVERTYTDVRVDTFQSLETKEQTEARRAQAAQSENAKAEEAEAGLPE